jgi:hypothetical protein
MNFDDDDVPYERGGHLAHEVTRAENRTGKDEPVVPMRQRCVAKERPGKRCPRWSVPGSNVCKYHGGGALRRWREKEAEQ